MTTNALSKKQLERFEQTTVAMLEFIKDDETYFDVLATLYTLPDGLITDLASLGLMYLATERARRHVAQTN